MKLAEAYDRFGFYAYHLAEHHGTPLGLAPSPGVFMVALAQRTKRLRFGPLVYLSAALPPAAPDRGDLHARSYERRSPRAGRGTRRLANRGRFFGVNPADGSRQFPEALRVIKQGLILDVLNFEGEFITQATCP